jgi:hypothetical protein
MFLEIIILPHFWVFLVVFFLFAYQNPKHFPYAPMHATCLAHLIFLDLIIVTVVWEEHRLWKSSLFSFLEPSVTSPVFGPNIFFDHSLVSQIEFHAGEIMVSYIIIITFLDSRWTSMHTIKNEKWNIVKNF